MVWCGARRRQYTVVLRSRLVGDRGLVVELSYGSA